ncbi:phosphoglucosamine mutase [Psychromonas sp. MB-3u-54]|uniref:phosphoglucosamine mutase n=1 Tax=Psychromonas sp. MB-3u-54 TaxID=2058319 RepID=UPI000C341458|nr:phosphoglucosamine mutase [Psychromonas sp. MB-3u-54]PKH04230.1 phosphoglucosamine mutase [Psychromonas sp. MB-3u-54]
MQRKYFGTDGVRGLVGQGQITPEFAMKLGWAAGRVLAKSGTRKVMIGKDTRVSGYMFESALEAGFVAAGVDVDLLGPIPTPAVAYLTKTFRGEAGVVISASHNPYHDNGIKFFSANGTKLSDEVELAIEAELDNHMQCVSSDNIGKVARINDAKGRYIEFCKNTFPSEMSLAGLRIVVDCAHGAAYQIAPHVFTELGAQVISIGIEPNGTNINNRCGATHLDTLQAKVLEERADLGIALDGDADRIMMVNADGSVIDGDQILFIIATDLQQQGKLSGGVVGTLMANMGLELALNALDIPFARSKVGDRYVVELLNQNGWGLGGENSGHILSLQHTSTGDGIVAGLQVLAAMQRSQQTLEQLLTGITMLPQVLINVRFSGKGDPLQNDAVTQAVLNAELKLAGRGRVLLRKSGTEPLIRVMVEGEELALVQSLAQGIADQVLVVDLG